MTLFSRLFRPITKIAITPPPAKPNRGGIAIILIVKNEARHIAEWARFHHSAGVSQFFVYDNASSDNTIEVLRATLPGDVLNVIPWAQPRFRTTKGREIHNQVLAYAHALMNFGPRFRWMAFIDVDEFLVPVTANSIPQAMEGLNGAARVSLPWQMFGRGGMKPRPRVAWWQTICSAPLTPLA